MDNNNQALLISKALRNFDLDRLKYLKQMGISFRNSINYTNDGELFKCIKESKTDIVIYLLQNGLSIGYEVSSCFIPKSDELYKKDPIVSYDLLFLALYFENDELSKFIRAEKDKLKEETCETALPKKSWWKRG